MAAQSSWSLADLLDLEFFLEEDKKTLLAGQEEELHQRDREIYQQIHTRCQHGDASEQASCLLRNWLEQRRAMVSGTSHLPGQVFSELIRLASWLFTGLALATGWGMTISFLSYSGTSPINVATFLAIFVCSQLLFLVLLLFFLSAGRLRTRPALPLTYSLVRRGLLALLKKLGRRLADAKSSRWLEQLSGNIHAYGDLYSRIFMLPIFLLVQLAAMGFNLGILAALLFKVMTTDLAFGWQTTLQAGAEAVARLVEIIALPWSWLLPAGVGYPDLAQIQGSHIILKEGIRHLSSTALTSWWPFLCLCVTVYGLLPRLLLYGGGRIMLRYLLKTFRFDSARHQRLLLRMQTPILSTSEAEHQTPEQPFDEPGNRPAREQHPLPAQKYTAVLLVPEEIADEYPIDALCARIGRETGYTITKTIFCDPYDPNIRADMPLAEAAQTVMILQEAWQPPINELFTFLHRLRELAGQKTLLTLFLIGKPEPEAPLAPPREQDYAIWRQKLSALGDPRLDVLSLGQS